MTETLPAIAPPPQRSVHTSRDGSATSVAIVPAPTTPFRRSSVHDAAAVSTELELRDLKETLRMQEIRLSSPRQPRRPDGQTIVANPVAGQQYAVRPYQRITPHKMWEPSFATDKDIVELSDRILRSEERLASRKHELEVQWAHRRILSDNQADDASNQPAADAGDSPTTGKATGSRPTSASKSALKSGSRPATGGSRTRFAPDVENPTPRDSFEGGFGLPLVALESAPNNDSIIRDRRETSTTSMDVPASMRRRSSAVKVSQGTIAVLAMLDGAPDLSLPAPKEVEFESRTGDILSEHHILKQDLFDGAFTRRDLVGIISGAPYFRVIPKFHIGGVAQAHLSGIRAALNALRRAHTSPSDPILWVNLREEPIVYLNGRSHIIRARDSPLHPQIIPNISGPRIAQIEQKLKREILLEAEQNTGNISVHHESANGSIEEQWESVNEDELLTLEDIFRTLHNNGINVEYRRRPITQLAMPQAADFQFVADICESYPNSPVIFNCQTGRGRSSLMMLAASIVRFYLMCKHDVDVDVSLLRVDGKANAYRTLQQLISLLPNGALHERRVAVLMELSDRIYSIADHINAALRAGQQTEKSRMRLAQYAYLLTFSCYCEQYFWEKSTSATFVKWVDQFQEVKVLLQNLTLSRNTSSMHLATERIATPHGVDETDELVNWIRHHRRGHVLCNNMILRSVPKDLKSGPATSVAGVVALRQLAPDVPMFTCGRVSETGREELLYNIHSGCPNVTKIVWVSIRAEPMIFINDEGFQLMEYNAALLQEEHVGDAASGSAMHVSYERLRELEQRLAKDVEAEARTNGGTVLVHRLNLDGSTDALKIKVKNVRTPHEVMEEFAATSAVEYLHIPVPHNGELLPSDIDPLLNFLDAVYRNADASGDNIALVLNDGDGALRTTIALNIAVIVRTARLGSGRDYGTAAKLHALLRGENTEKNFSLSTGKCYYGLEEEDSLPTHHVELQAASSIAQMVAAGSLLKFVDALIALGGSGRVWNLLHAIDHHKQGIAANDTSSPAVIAALEVVRKYLLVLLAAIYMDEQGRNAINARPLFSEWVETFEEIKFMLDRLHERPQHSLKLIDHRNLMDSTVSENFTVDRRSGDVLTANYAMKADHFPGCQKKGLRPQVSGAPNFRKVDFINVYGVAIPTILGVHNVLSVLGASERPLVEVNNEANDDELWIGYATPRVFDPSVNSADTQATKNGRVVWVNLREEPLIYVGDRPFVFRDLQQPYVNVELTGIESHKIELVEESLKKDILTEAAQYGGKFLVHDEGKPGELVGLWEEANEGTVRTVRQVYNEAVADGCRVTFLRLPVTDEQSPELKDFDMLVENLLPTILAHSDDMESSPVSFVFNCQMGRGRTTTGMVVCSLLLGAIFPQYYDLLDQRYTSLFGADDSELSKGNYHCVKQLKALLADGRDAKKRLDLVLEACSRMQNLRSAIELFVNQVSSPDVTEEARARAHHHGVHYLQRYFNLIAFSSYLNEEFNPYAKSLNRSFVSWMADRPEIVSIHDKASLS